jgi:dihydrofolate reductase
MRKIIAGMFMTLDGIIGAPEKWNLPYYDDEMTQTVASQLADSDLHLYGRRSYELYRMVFTGPHAPPHAQAMTDAQKVVVSTTLGSADWGPATVIGENVKAELTKLKEQPGKNINVGASGTLVRFLLAEGLLDELRLLVHPIVVGSGERLFEGGSSAVPLQLLDARPHVNGVVAMHYAGAS